MSLPSKVVLGSSCVLCAGTIFYVHYKQWSDKKKLHEGVIRDVERQRRRKIENLYMLQQQKEINKAFQVQKIKEKVVSS